MPLLGRLSIRAKDLPKLPDSIDWAFRTKPQLAGARITWAGSLSTGDRPPPWVVVDGASPHRQAIQPAQKAGRVVVARLRREATLSNLPPQREPGPKRGPGRPPISGQSRLSLAKRAGHQRGGQTSAVGATTGPVTTKTVKTFRATWHPAGGLVRVVIVTESDGAWRADLGTDPEAGVEEIVPVTLARWSIAQNFHDWKEVEGIEQVHLRRVGSNVGALNHSRWVHSRVE